MISQQERARRRAAFEDGIHSSYLEEMRKRLRKRYGITSNAHR